MINQVIIRIKVIYREDSNLWKAYNIAADPEEEINILPSISKSLKDKLNKFINRNNKTIK